VRLDKGVFLDLETVDCGQLDLGCLADSLACWNWHPNSDPSEILSRIHDADVVVTNSCILDRRILESASRLRLVTLTATGVDNVDLRAASENGIAVCNIRDYCSQAVSQHAITLMLNLLTGQPWQVNGVREGAWSDSPRFGLALRPIRQAGGLVFGVIGNGVLGRATGALAQKLGMEVRVAARRGQAPGPGPGRVTFEELLEVSDVVSIHCPLNEDTRDLIGHAELELMKSDALLINTARGGIVNERALARALREGLIGGAGIDTLSTEPPPSDHPLLDPDIPNLLVTPHAAWASRAARQAALEQVAQIIRSFASGKVMNQVN
jgi:glycerate dehydrogenase